MRVARARQRLRRRRQELVSQLESLKGGLVPGARESTQELSLSDNHPADLGSETYEREKDLGLHRLVKQQVFEVDLALHRLDQGSYGRCEGCGGLIPDARLEVLPEARRCTFCQAAARPPLRRRPVEEEVLASGELTTAVDPGAVESPRDRE